MNILTAKVRLVERKQQKQFAADVSCFCDATTIVGKPEMLRLKLIKTAQNLYLWKTRYKKLFIPVSPEK